MAEEKGRRVHVEMDEEVYRREIARGTPERVARALAKSAAVRKRKASEAGVAPTPPPPPEVPSGEVPSGLPRAAPAGAGQPRETAPAGPVAERPSRVATLPATEAEVAAPGARTQRFLGVVRPEAIQKVEPKAEDKANTWPHLFMEEFLAALIVLAGLLIFSTFVNAPLRELANPNLTPNPSKAPWYFLGLQELLHYFHPQVAGVTIPGLGILFLMAIPYMDKNPSARPERRKLAIILFTMFLMFWATLVIIGSFFRGPGFNWVWPWSQGLFFEL